MATAEQLKALLKSHIDGDQAHFFSIAMQVAAREAKIGHGKLADDLRSIIDSAKEQRAFETSNKNLVHISQPRGELANLLEVSYPSLKLVDIVLKSSISDRLERIIKEQRNYRKIKDYGLHPRRKILLIGPPGTGKTLTASILAGELGIPLFIVRLDSLITKFMGETAAKLRQIFDAIRDTRGVYFFDEFDSIGSQRSASNDVGEARRILNSFLLMIEQDTSNSLIVAATNHPEILDYALFRRFDDIVEYDFPDSSQIINVLKNRLGSHVDKRINWLKVSEHGKGLSYAEITRAAQDTIKDAIIQDRSCVSDQEIISHLKERKEFCINNYIK